MFGIGEEKKAAKTVEAVPVQEEEQVVAEEAVEEQTSDDAIAELTSKIDEIESKIREMYAKLGEAYFNLHEDDAEDALASLVGEVKGKFGAIENCRNKINELKGIVICDVCGVEVKNTSTFCTECGNKLKKVVVAMQGINSCSNCNSPVEAGAKFCSICGFKIEKVMAKKAAPVESEEAAPVVTVAPQPKAKVHNNAPGKKCPACGQKLESFDKMCFACGEVFE